MREIDDRGLNASLGLPNVAMAAAGDHHIGVTLPFYAWKQIL